VTREPRSALPAARLHHHQLIFLTGTRNGWYRKAPRSDARRISAWERPLRPHIGSDEVRLLGGLLTSPAVPGLVLIDAWRYAEPGGPGFAWDHRNGYLAERVLPDARIDYILLGLPRHGRGKVLSVQLAGTAPVEGIWPSDHFAVVADLRQ
jgi:exonuclease III